MGIFSFEPGLAIWTWIAFGILLFIMSKFVFPTLLKNIKEREKAISDAVDNADEIKKRLNDIETEHQKILNEAKNESNRILIETRENSDKLKKELMIKAEKEANAVIEEAKTRISEERKIAIESIKQEVAELICESSEKAIGHSFMKENDKKWVKELIDQKPVVGNE